MFAGYADDHSGDVYRSLNIKTKRIIMSRDARRLNIVWNHFKKKHNYARRQLELFLDEEQSLVWKEMNQWKIELRVMGTTHPHREN